MKESKFKIGDKVFVIDWGNHYSKFTFWKDNEKQNFIDWETEIPNYSGIDHFWEYRYETNLTLKGTVNKREPRKLVEKIPVYKNFKWEIVEIKYHPNAGEYYYEEEQRKKWGDGKYTESPIYLIVSFREDMPNYKCYAMIGEKGLSYLTPKQFADKQFNALIEANLGLWDRNRIHEKKLYSDIPEAIKSVFYDENDSVLFGSSVIKGLVSYNYLEGKFSTDKKPIYLGCSILYDGKGNSALSSKDKELIKPFKYIKSYVES